MPEMMYTGEGIVGFTDRYVFESLSGRALKNRISSVSERVTEIIKGKIDTNNGKIKIANFGSGTGRDTIEIFLKNPNFRKFVLVDCIDIDGEALKISKELFQEKELSNFNFVEKNIMKLPYNREIDIGLLVGVLCGLPYRSCMIVLRKIRKYLKKGGILVASNVLKRMKDEDPLTAWLISGIVGWKLVYKTESELQNLFEESGYKWQGLFYDEPSHFHAMGVGLVY